MRLAATSSGAQTADFLPRPLARGAVPAITPPPAYRRPAILAKPVRP